MVTKAFADRQAHLEAYQQKQQYAVNTLSDLIEHEASQVVLQKPTSNLFRHRKSAATRLNLASFDQVISIDTKKNLVEVEGMITFEALVRATLVDGYIPAVVPELKTITVGGALAGVGIESSSFRYGLVHETVVEFDVLLASGEVVTCKPDNEYKDLFYAFPNSYGTLGYALRVVLKIIPTKPYVELTHHHFSSSAHFYMVLEQLVKDNHRDGSVAFLDAVVFSDKELVITQGNFVEKPRRKVSNYKYMQMYYRSVQSETYDCLSTEDYIWRWDTDWFWCSKVFGLQNPFLRLLFGKFMLKSSVYSKLMRFAKRNGFVNALTKQLRGSSESVIQDVAIPIDKAKVFLDFFQREIGITPVWNCPILAARPNQRYDFFPLNPKQLYVNFGFWDMVSSDKESGHFNRLIEKKVVELGGLKSLYSNSYYTEQEFWNIYNQNLYRELKKKYDPEGHFGDLYYKCTEKTD